MSSLNSKAFEREFFPGRLSGIVNKSLTGTQSLNIISGSEISKEYIKISNERLNNSQSKLKF